MQSVQAVLARNSCSVQPQLKDAEVSKFHNVQLIKRHHLRPAVPALKSFQEHSLIVPYWYPHICVPVWLRNTLYVFDKYDVSAVSRP